MRHPSRGATSQKLLIFAVLLATSIRQILRPVQARTLLPSLGSFNGDDNNTGYSRSQDETSSAEVFNGTQLFLEEEVVELTNSTLDLEEREEEPSSSYVLVVVQTANLELLHRELLSFEQLFSTSKFRRKVRFRRWKGEFHLGSERAVIKFICNYYVTVASYSSSMAREGKLLLN